MTNALCGLTAGRSASSCDVTLTKKATNGDTRNVDVDETASLGLVSNGSKNRGITILTAEPPVFWQHATVLVHWSLRRS
jgi:hypothetical protein